MASAWVLVSWAGRRGIIFFSLERGAAKGVMTDTRLINDASRDSLPAPPLLKGLSSTRLMALDGLPSPRLTSRHLTEPRLPLTVPRRPLVQLSYLGFTLYCLTWD